MATLGTFAYWLTRTSDPLLPPRIVLDRNRGGAYLSMLIASAGMFGSFLFMTYYLQQTLGYSPVLTGVAFLPMIGGIGLAANVSNVVVMPRIGPKPVTPAGMFVAAAAALWLTRLGPHTAYATGVLGPLILIGVGLGLVISPVINTGTFGVARHDAGVASASVTVGQQLGASIGTSLLNTVFATAIASYVAAHAALARTAGPHAVLGSALAHGYDTAFWWITVTFAAGALVGGAILRPGPLVHPDASFGTTQGRDQGTAADPAIPA